MSKEICISSTPHETRLAILENDQLAEIYYERENEYTLAGSIYKGRVIRVLPGMQSAFVEVGLERDAFLYVTDFLEEQGDSADFERVPAGTPRHIAPEPGSDRITESASGEPRSEAEPGQEQNREQGRNRGRGRNRGQRGNSQRNGSPRPEAKPSQPLSIEPFDSASVSQVSVSQVAYPKVEEVADVETAPAAISPNPENAAEEEGFDQGTRRWRGRRGRRGGARAREPQAAGATSRPAQRSGAAPVETPVANTTDEAFSESEPIPARVDSISAGHAAPARPAAAVVPTVVPIVLPGESISKYGQSPSASHAAAPTQSGRTGAAKPSAPTPTRPSFEIPLSWDGSGALPGESISRYRRPSEAPSQPAPVSTLEDADDAAPEVSAYPEAAAPETGLSASETSADPAQEPAAESAHQAHEAHSTAISEPVSEEEDHTFEESVTEFEPDEASASHRIDPSAPSEFRVASPPEEHETEEQETEEEVVEPVAYNSVAPPVGTEIEAYPEHHHEAHAFAAAESAPPVREEAKPHAEGFWHTIKELVTGHAPPRDESHSGSPEPGTLRTIEGSGDGVEGSVDDVPEQSLAMRYEETQEEAAHHPHSHHPILDALTSEPAPPAPGSELLENEHPDEPIFDIPYSNEPLFTHHHDASQPTHQTPVLDPKEEDDADSPGFAPGSGVIEEETIDDEEYDYEPIHAYAEDHDLEDLEEETLERQAGIELGEMVREAHLEQRVKSSFNGAPAIGEEADEDTEEESYNEEGSVNFTEEEEQAEGEYESSEDEGADDEAIAAAPAGTGPRRDNGNRDTSRNVDRNAGRERSGDGRNRGRGRRPGGNGSGGNRRQNTQSSDLPIISELLKPGQEILVQIAKEPIAKKGARITSHIALPGRFLVFMPTVNHVGVSRKISSDEERQRLKRILISEKGAAAGGFIVRTAADGASEEDLRADIRFLLALWNEIKQRSDEAKAPALLYHDLNLIERVLRDQVSDNFSAIWVDSETEYERIVRFLQRFQPSLVRRVKLYTKETPLFEQFGIQEEISKALKSKVWLKSGGSIVINQTEALVAIDINTGKFVGKTTRLEDTIVRTNLDAIPEIVRQIRLRDLGGIIVIDFIDMDERKNRNRVLQALEDELKNDRAPSKVLQFNDFGLIAITRKRVKQSLERTLSVQCDVCAGTGMVKSPTTVCNEIYTEMRNMHRTLERKDVLLRVHPEVVKSLKSTSGRWLNELEEMTGKTIIVKSDPALHPEQFDIH